MANRLPAIIINRQAEACNNLTYHTKQFSNFVFFVQKMRTVEENEWHFHQQKRTYFFMGEGLVHFFNIWLLEYSHPIISIALSFVKVVRSVSQEEKTKNKTKQNKTDMNNLRCGNLDLFSLTH